MNAHKYFAPEQLLDLENVLFSIDTESKLRYVLIDQHRKEYFTGKTSNAPGLISRLRSCVMKCDYKRMAHFLQIHANTSQMSDWCIAVLNKNTSDNDVQCALYGFKQIKQAQRYEVNPKENTVVIQAINSRYRVEVHFITSQVDAETSRLACYARNKAATIASLFKKNNPNASLPYDVKLHLELLEKCGIHAAQEQWQFNVVPDIKGLTECNAYAKKHNAVFPGKK